MHGRADEVLDGLDVCTAAVGEKVYMYELMDGNAECIPSSLQLSPSVNGRARCGSVVRGGRERAHWLTQRRTRPRVRNSWTHNSFRIDCRTGPSRLRTQFISPQSRRVSRTSARRAPTRAPRDHVPLSGNSPSSGRHRHLLDLRLTLLSSSLSLGHS